MPENATPKFWKSAGAHLLNRDANGWLAVTPDFLRAYFTRPEVHPIDTSCAQEVRLFEELMADPFSGVAPERLALLADPDAADNYRVVLTFRDLLAGAGTLEAAYLKLMRGSSLAVPPVFVDQMVHAILANMLGARPDPMQLRAAELFFREQSVSAEGGQLMLADEEIVERNAKSDTTSLAQLIKDSGTPLRRIELDILTQDNKAIYWSRSDRFDTVIDFRFTQAANDAFARVAEAWIAHFLGLRVRIQPKAKIEDADWRWHIGLDKEASRILNGLYQGQSSSLEQMAQIIGLFTLAIEDRDWVVESVRGRPIYLGLAMTREKRVKMKPQNLLVNLPLVRRA